MLATIASSAESLALLRQHAEQHGQIDVDDSNRGVYRELARAGLVVAGHNFTGGDEGVYRLTKLGFERKAELLSMAKEAG